MARDIAIVAEDRLTQAVLQKCVQHALPRFRVVRSEVKHGRGNVQRELAAYSKLSQIMPVLVGVDLDGDECAPSLLANWLANAPLPGLLVRVAVREVESWVLADRRRTSAFLGAVPDDITKSPDDLGDPKRALLDLARARASAELKRDLIPRNFAQYPRIGPAYNLQMCKFVEDRWRPHVAQRRSDSLARAIRAMASIDPDAA